MFHRSSNSGHYFIFWILFGCSAYLVAIWQFFRYTAVFFFFQFVYMNWAHFLPGNFLKNRCIKKNFKSSCNIKGFWKYFTFYKNLHLCEISLKFHKKSKSAITQKLSRTLKFWSLHVQPLKRAGTLFPHFFHKMILFYTFLFTYFQILFFYVHRMAQPLSRFGWNFIQLKTLPRGTIACK